MSVRASTIEDLPAMESVAAEFYRSTKFLEDFRISRFSEIWTALLGNGNGVIFIEHRGDEIAGVMGGIVHRDLYGESLIAEEMFWFVKKEMRGAGIALYRYFEQWAIDKGAKTIQMVHLLDLMPDKVRHFYTRQGYYPIETRYSKSLI